MDKILFITLSNIGDSILTLPSLDFLKENFPQSRIFVLGTSRPAEIFQDNPDIEKFIVYDKHSKLTQKLRLLRILKKEKFDAVIDFRNSLFGVLLPVSFKISPFLAIPKNIRHMKDRHLYKVHSLKLKVQSRLIPRTGKISIHINAHDEEYVNKILGENNIKKEDAIVIVSPGARSHIKRWDRDKFADLVSCLIEKFMVKVILVGDKADAAITGYIAKQAAHSLVDLAGKTSLAQLAFLLKRADFAITNDSAVLHLASYVNIPVLAIFGPTDEKKYGPWPEKSLVVKKEIFCRPCQKAQCRFGTLECLRFIKTEDVLKAANKLLNSQYSNTQCKENFKRILITRTDRIGDVLLSTPVIKELRNAYPNSYIAMMVGPYARDIIEGNPDLDEAIIYDKNNRHKNWLSSFKFALRLKKKRFDLAVILHPTNRVHIISFLAGIPRRLGYDRKFGFLLTDRIKHTKQLGQKHELEYNLDMLRYLGIQSEDKNPFMPIKPESELWVRELFKQEGIKQTDRLLAIHPGASCPSKIWRSERFAAVADILVQRYGFKVFLVAGPKDINISQNIIKYMHKPVINLAGRTSISQLASLLKTCQLFISNDSGPVHIASALGVPVISIFGRNQPGLGPRRWAAVGERGKFLHREVGCPQCLAHNCKKDFACLNAITVEDVLNAADSILKDIG